MYRSHNGCRWYPSAEKATVGCVICLPILVPISCPRPHCCMTSQEPQATFPADLVRFWCLLIYNCAWFSEF